ncbi:DUF2442 domain-containing protein [Ramlibacter sp.]|uniref:DUF2442 domain-containing protein n=1 Tax=Ramlibacter sp. TaxID=1917967 RepID=UPI003D1277F6
MTTARRAYTKLDTGDIKLLAARHVPPAANPWAVTSVSIRRAKDGARLVLVFDSGDMLGIPLALVSELAGATREQLQELRLSPARDTIIADKVDAYISVKGLIRDYARQVPPFADRMGAVSAARAGAKSSTAKRLSSAENGRKGGRPRRNATEHAVAAKSSRARKPAAKS